MSAMQQLLLRLQQQFNKNRLIGHKMEESFGCPSFYHYRITLILCLLSCSQKRTAPPLSQGIDKLFQSLTDVFIKKLSNKQEEHGHHSQYYSEFQVLFSLEFATCKGSWGFLMTFGFLIIEITVTAALQMQTATQALAEISAKFSFTR